MEEWINPKSINWSQTTAGGRGRWDDVFGSMSKQGWNGPAIDVVRTPSGQLVTIDNTRLTAATDLNINKIPVNIHDMNDKLPSMKLPNGEQRFGEAKTWGDALKQRTENNKLPIDGTNKRPKTPQLKAKSG